MSLAFEVGGGGTRSELVTTPDRQLVALFPDGAFGSAVQVVVRPLDPRRLAPAPRGTDFDSNAYEITAVGEDEARLLEPVALALRYAQVGHGVVVLDTGRWRAVEAQDSHATFQARLDAPTLGTFAVVADASRLTKTSAGTRNTGVAVAVIAVPILLLVALGAVAARRRRTAR